MFDLVRSIQARDPATPTFLEVIFGYNGFHAIALHRMNNALWKLGLHALARFFANISRIFTGIEIHPEAVIGREVFIDHGTGVVIGQTAVIEDGVTIYHGVTLGGKGGDMPGSKRHPTIKADAIIGAGAQVLGNIEIGARAKVGANAVVMGCVPEGCTVVGNPARLVRCEDADKGKAYGLPRHLIDPVAEAISGLLKDVEALKKQVDLPNEKQESKESYAAHWKEGCGKG